VTFRNTLSRSVTYWLRGAPAPTGMNLLGRAHYSVAPDYRSDPVTHWVEYLAPLHMDWVTIERGESRSSFPYEWAGRAHDGWAPVAFGPGEQISLVWLATTTGCHAYMGELGGAAADGDWVMDSWLTDGAIESSPSDLSNVPSYASLNTGKLTYTLHAVSGDWNHPPEERRGCN